MKQVIIGMKNGQPYVVAAPRKITVIIKQEKKRTFKKVLKTWLYQAKVMLRMA